MSPASYRIGFVADTHDVDDPAGVVELLAGQNCDYNVHLGDIGGSRMVMNVVRDFKRHVGDVSHLPPEQRQRFTTLLNTGVSPLRAYVEARIPPDSIPARIAETTGAYRAILRVMAGLSHPLLLRGNVDGMQLRTPAVEACFAESPLDLAKRPRLIDLGWLGLVIWPSWRPVDEGEQAELARITQGLSSAARGKSHLIVLAHEHFFKGPIAAVYTRRVATAGLSQLSVPRFDPNPTWPCLMQFFRGLPDGARSYYVFGHVHDGESVLAAGAPALRNRAGPGLRYRLFGLGWRGERRSSKVARRGLTMLPVAIDEVAVLGVSRHGEDISWEVQRYERPEREGPSGGPL